MRSPRGGPRPSAGQPDTRATITPLGPNASPIRTNNKEVMDLRLVMVALLLVQSVLPAPICTGFAACGGMTACVVEAPGAGSAGSACTPRCSGAALPPPCCVLACEPACEASGDLPPGEPVPCRPVCAPCPLGQPIAPTVHPGRATPAEAALLPTGPAIHTAARLGEATLTTSSFRTGSLIGPDSRPLLCVWVI